VEGKDKTMPPEILCSICRKNTNDNPEIGDSFNNTLNGGERKIIWQIDAFLCIACRDAITDNIKRAINQRVEKG
jgi:hypothetical protein